MAIAAKTSVCHNCGRTFKHYVPRQTWCTNSCKEAAKKFKKLNSTKS